jgi:hypothetical protein
MARHQWTILCSQATVNSLTNNISLIEVIDEITVPVDPNVDLTIGFPVDTIVPFLSTLVSSFERDDRNTPERLIGRSSLVSPAGRTHDNNFDVDLSAHQRVRCLITQNGVPIREPGTYVFRVALQDLSGAFTDVSSFSLQVIMTH